MWPNHQETAIWSHLLKKPLMKDFIFCPVYGKWKYDVFDILDEVTST